MRYVDSFDYEQGGFDVTIFELTDGNFIMDIKDLHGRIIWGFEGLTSLKEAKELATKEIEILNTIEDLEDLIDYL